MQGFLGVPLDPEALGMPNSMQWRSPQSERGGHKTAVPQQAAGL